MTSSLLFLAETAIVAEVWAVSTSFNSGGVEKSSSLADSGHIMSGGQGALGKTIKNYVKTKKKRSGVAGGTFGASGLVLLGTFQPGRPSLIVHPWDLELEPQNP